MANPGLSFLLASLCAAQAPPPGDKPDVQVNVRSRDDQNETPIAVDPHDWNHWVAGANDGQGAAPLPSFYATFDGGLTFSELRFSDPDGLGNGYDPNVAIGPSGEVYFSLIGAGVTKMATYVGKSTDGGVTVPRWRKAVIPSGNFFDDRPTLAVDATGGPLGGNVYIAFVRIASTNSVIESVTSSDGGVTWSLPARVSDSSSAAWGIVAVGANGEVDVVFKDLSDSTLKFDTSPDGGVTWGNDVKIADTSFSGIPNFPSASSQLPEPAIAVDRSGGPFNGSIYVVWPNDSMVSGSPDVLLSSSRDGGATWSPPSLASDVATNAQFQPAIDVDANGNVVVGFYDRRDDPADTLIRYYVSRSSDGGVTFQKNVGVSDVAFDPYSYPQGRSFIGHYTGVAASSRSAYAVWTDGRTGNNEVFSSRVQLDLFTDTETIPAATGGTVQFTVSPGPLWRFADYRVLGSISGTSPGIDFGPVNVPLDYDAFMLATIALANSGSLPGFSGTLDATGSSTAAVVSGPLAPALVGLQMDFAAFVEVGGIVGWASDPTHLEIVP